MLVAGIITVLAGALVLAHIQRKEAVSQREVAEKARDDAEGLIEFMVFDLKDKLTPIGKLDLLDSVSKQVNAYYESITAENASPENLRRQGFALENYGYVLSEQGKVFFAKKNYDKALSEIEGTFQFLNNLVERDPQNLLWQDALATYYEVHGDIRFAQKRIDEALDDFKKGCTILKSMVKRNSNNLSWQRNLKYTIKKLQELQNLSQQRKK